MLQAVYFGQRKMIWSLRVGWSSLVECGHYRSAVGCPLHLVSRSCVTGNQKIDELQTSPRTL